MSIAGSVALAILSVGCTDTQSLRPTHSSVGYNTYEDALNSYATELTARFKGDPNITVVPADVEYGAGTILMPNADIFDTCPVSLVSYVKPDPQEIQWMPGISSEKHFSASGSLPVVLAQILQFSGSVNTNETVSLDFEHLQQHYIGLSALQQMLTSEGCGPIVNSALKDGGPVSIVRGTIQGQEDFNFSDAPSFSVSAGVKKVGNFSISGGGGSGPIKFSENSPTTHFLVLYSVAAPESVVAAAASPPALASSNIAPAAPAAPVAATASNSSVSPPPQTAPSANAGVAVPSPPPVIPNGPRAVTTVAVSPSVAGPSGGATTSGTAPAPAVLRALAATIKLQQPPMSQ
jgi:hypothetical protein